MTKKTRRAGGARRSIGSTTANPAATRALSPGAAVQLAAGTATGAANAGAFGEQLAGAHRGEGYPSRLPASQGRRSRATVASWRGTFARSPSGFGASRPLASRRGPSGLSASDRHPRWLQHETPSGLSANSLWLHREPPLASARDLAPNPLYSMRFFACFGQLGDNVLRQYFETTLSSDSAPSGALHGNA